MAIVRNLIVASMLACAFGNVASAQSSDAELRAAVAKGMKAGAMFYRTKVASHGGYVYYYRVDLQERWGEGKANADTLFVQPPGTPTVGMAYLKAYEATRDAYYLDAVRETAEALVYGQLASGGWTQTIHFGPAKRVGKYRNGKGGSWNVSSLDDDQTQAAMRMLMHADRALGFKHEAIHEAVAFGLKSLLAAQFPNGAFPQVWTKPVEAKPIMKANFPGDNWRTAGKEKNYWDYYTLNDNLAGTVADTLITAHQIYKEDKYKAALMKLGDFLILAQMPAPQPGWCQQYNYEMVPIWARKFEPPAITGWESQDVMETLINISRYTGEQKYLEPIPRALAYFKKNLLADGKIARYYEFKSNRPLYMDAKYQLTYDDSAAPKHYGWKQPARFDEIEKSYELARLGKSPPNSGQDREAGVRGILRDLDEQGRWITTYAGERLVGQPKFATGFRFLSSEVFSRNLTTLSYYLASPAP
jgi:PelA/Pel-15E family pectate lyase